MTSQVETLYQLGLSYVFSSYNYWYSFSSENRLTNSSSQHSNGLSISSTTGVLSNCYQLPFLGLRIINKKTKRSDLQKEE
jgi:hypothetical protein